MRKYWKEILLALVLGLALPWAVAAAGKKSPGPATEITATGATETTTAPTEAAARTLKVLQNGQTVEMDLDEYLTEVLLGEIPADFEPEAKKAQAEEQPKPKSETAAPEQSAQQPEQEQQKEEN